MSSSTIFGPLAPEELEILDSELETRYGSSLFNHYKHLIRDVNTIGNIGTGCDDTDEAATIRIANDREIQRNMQIAQTKLSNLMKDYPIAGETDESEGETAEDVIKWSQSFIRDIQAVQEEMKEEEIDMLMNQENQAHSNGQSQQQFDNHNLNHNVALTSSMSQNGNLSGNVKDGDVKETRNVRGRGGISPQPETIRSRSASRNRNRNGPIIQQSVSLTRNKNHNASSGTENKNSQGPGGRLFGNALTQLVNRDRSRSNMRDTSHERKKGLGQITLKPNRDLNSNVNTQGGDVSVSSARRKIQLNQNNNSSNLNLRKAAPLIEIDDNVSEVSQISEPRVANRQNNFNQNQIQQNNSLKKMNDQSTISADNQNQPQTRSRHANTGRNLDDRNRRSRKNGSDSDDVEIINDDNDNDGFYNNNNKMNRSNRSYNDQVQTNQQTKRSKNQSLKQGRGENHDNNNRSNNTTVNRSTKDRKDRDNTNNTNNTRRRKQDSGDHHSNRDVDARRGDRRAKTTNNNSTLRKSERESQRQRDQRDRGRDRDRDNRDNRETVRKGNKKQISDKNTKKKKVNVRRKDTSSENEQDDNDTNNSNDNEDNSNSDNRNGSSSNSSSVNNVQIEASVTSAGTLNLVPNAQHATAAANTVDAISIAKQGLNFAQIQGQNHYSNGGAPVGNLTLINSTSQTLNGNGTVNATIGNDTTIKTVKGVDMKGVGKGAGGKKGKRFTLVKWKVDFAGQVNVRISKELNSALADFGTLEKGEIVEQVAAVVNIETQKGIVVRMPITHPRATTYPEPIGWVTLTAEDCGGPRFFSQATQAITSIVGQGGGKGINSKMNNINSSNNINLGLTGGSLTTFTTKGSKSAYVNPIHAAAAAAAAAGKWGSGGGGAYPLSYKGGGGAAAAWGKAAAAAAAAVHAATSYQWGSGLSSGKGKGGASKGIKSWAAASAPAGYAKGQNMIWTPNGGGGTTAGSGSETGSANASPNTETKIGEE